MARNTHESLLYRFGFSVLACLVALALTAALEGIMGEARFFVFFAAVVFSAWQGGFLPGLLCAALSILMLDYFLLEPRGEIFTTPLHIVQFFVFALVTGLVSWLEDRRYRSERTANELKSELEVIFNAVNEGITVQDPDGTVRYVNETFSRIIGQPIHTMVGGLIGQFQQRYEVFNEAGEIIGYAAMPRHRVFATGQSSELHFGLRDRQTRDERWLNLKTSPVFDDKGKVRLAVNVVEDITEKQRTEKQRQATEQRLRKVLDNLAAFVGVMTPDGILLEINRSALQASQLKPEEVLGKPLASLPVWTYDADIQASVEDAVKRAAAGETVRHDIQVKLPSGDFLIIDFMIAPVLDSDGRVEFLIPSGIDITSRLDLTNRLKAQQRRMEDILNSIPGIVYEGTSAPDLGQQHMQYISQYAEQMLGYPMKVWRESPNFWRQVVHPEDWEAAVERVSANFRDKKPGPVAFRCIASDGRTVQAEAYNGVITDLNGQPTGTCGIVLDVTERRRQEAEIRRLNLLINYQRDRLERMISNVPGIVFEGLTTPAVEEQSTAFMSAYTVKMLGYRPEEWINDPEFWQKIMPPEDWKSSQEQALEIWEHGESGVIPFRCTASDGRLVHIEAHFSVIRDEEGKSVGLVGVMMDVTERRRIEQDLAQYAEELRRSNEELEQFAYVASHDLQEPLRMVTSYLQLIEQRYGETLDKDGKEFFAFAIDGATRMKVLINDLLAYSRIQRSAAELETVNMDEVLEQVLHNLQLRIEDTCAVITRDPLPEVTANRVQMIQLLQNLISNALKFRGDRTPEIHVGVQRDGANWHFTVRDNGIGIESEYLERIFVIFQRLHSRGQYPGTGIGLAISKKIVDKHDGAIHAESTPGEGSTFHFTLPIQRTYRRISHATGSDPSGR
ncbi:MAG: PAS domain S-box protein [Chloroflexi bacterium]|nr:PAS domain S-box protein [Chloroflexota bacterium]